MKRVIYADNAATTKLDEATFDAMKPFLLEEYGNPSQPYSLSRAPKHFGMRGRRLLYVLELYLRRYSLLQGVLRATIGQLKDRHLEMRERGRLSQQV